MVVEPDNRVPRDGENKQLIDVAAGTKPDIIVHSEKNQTSHKREHTLCNSIYIKLQKSRTDL